MDGIHWGTKVTSLFFAIVIFDTFFVLDIMHLQKNKFTLHTSLEFSKLLLFVVAVVDMV